MMLVTLCDIRNIVDRYTQIKKGRTEVSHKLRLCFVPNALLTNVCTMTLFGGELSKTICLPFSPPLT